MKQAHYGPRIGCVWKALDMLGGGEESSQPTNKTKKHAIDGDAPWKEEMLNIKKAK